MLCVVWCVLCSVLHIVYGVRTRECVGGVWRGMCGGRGVIGAWCWLWYIGGYGVWWLRYVM